VTPVLAAPPERPSRVNGRVPPVPPPTGGDDGSDREPRRGRPLLDNVVLATLFVIGGEIMLFAGLVFSFWVVRLSAPVWPPPLQPRLPIGVTAVSSVVLLASSLTMVGAVRARRQGDRERFLGGLAVTAALGAAFLAVQGYEWFRLIGFGLTVSSGTYGATFYTLIGAHAAHVVAALVWLGCTVMLASRGRFAGRRAAAVTACAMYWHFVVALWPILYVSVYLL
jgi:heme/copper-type cytochrome/quinol oxidase subunit 3